MTEEPIRQPRDFEPPPWEREQFDELARRRAEAAAAEAAAGRQAEQAAVAAAAEPAEGVEPAAVAVPAGARGPAEGMTRDEVAPRVSGGPDAASVDVMLMGLAAEEPRAFRNVWVVWIVAAVVFGAVGVIALVLGLFGVANARGSGVAVGWAMALNVGGIAALGTAGWMLTKALGERGA